MHGTEEYIFTKLKTVTNRWQKYSIWTEFVIQLINEYINTGCAGYWLSFI